MIPEELLKDADALKKRGFDFRTIEADSKIYIQFDKFPVSSKAYTQETTDLLIFTSPSYPYAGFDMFWTDPNLFLKDGATPGQAQVMESHLKKLWRRFSYHPYRNHPWNPAVDDIGRFVAYVEQRLRQGD